MRLLGAVDDWLKEKKSQPNSAWHDVEFDFVGVTAGIRDLDAVNQSDTFWVGVYVAVAVLIVLIFLLRRPLLSLYLIFTVVFGYLVSLGLTHLFFAWLYGSTYQGLDWKLKIFLFVILVAVGEDYNIYLVTRVLEEQRRRGLLPGLREAVVRTGGIITSCGVIMAGTFGSMATGTLRSMIELGFAMSLGVLLGHLHHPHDPRARLPGLAGPLGSPLGRRKPGGTWPRRISTRWAGTWCSASRWTSRAECVQRIARRYPA